MELIATGLFSGKLPRMPGTWGSILAAMLIYLLWPPSAKIQAAVIVITFFLSVISSDYVSKNLGNKDPDCVVIDEIIGMQITFFGLPAEHNLKLTFLGLIIFRIIDIMKPPPIPLFEKLPGGWGITVDDVIAGILTNVALRLLGGLI